MYLDSDNKLDLTSTKGIYMGHDKHNDSYYRIYDMNKNKIIISRDVKFYDTSFNNAKALNESINSDNSNELSESSIRLINFYDDYINDDNISDKDIASIFNNYYLYHIYVYTYMHHIQIHEYYTNFHMEFSIYLLLLIVHLINVHHV
jgi:hypothetical protein